MYTRFEWQGFDKVGRLNCFDALTGVSYIGSFSKHTLFVYLLVGVVTVDISINPGTLLRIVSWVDFVLGGYSSLKNKMMLYLLKRK